MQLERQPRRSGRDGLARLLLRLPVDLGALRGPHSRDLLVARPLVDGQLDAVLLEDDGQRGEQLDLRDAAAEARPRPVRERDEGAPWGVVQLRARVRAREPAEVLRVGALDDDGRDLLFVVVGGGGDGICWEPAPRDEVVHVGGGAGGDAAGVRRPVARVALGGSDDQVELHGAWEQVLLAVDGEDLVLARRDLLRDAADGRHQA